MALMGYKAPKRRASSFGMVPGAEGGKAEPADKPGLMSNAKVGTLNAGLPGGSVPTYTGNYGNVDAGSWGLSPTTTAGGLMTGVAKGAKPAYDPANANPGVATPRQPLPAPGTRMVLTTNGWVAVSSGRRSMDVSGRRDIRDISEFTLVANPNGQGSQWILTDDLPEGYDGTGSLTPYGSQTLDEHGNRIIENVPYRNNMVGPRRNVTMSELPGYSRNPSVSAPNPTQPTPPQTGGAGGAGGVTPATGTTGPIPTSTPPTGGTGGATQPTTTTTPSGGIGGVAPPQPTSGGAGGAGVAPGSLPEPGNAGDGPSGNTAPTSTAGAVPNITNNLPGTSGPVTQQRADDFFNMLSNLFLARDQQLGGANGPYGNNFDAQGNLVLPDWLQQGLMAQFNAGANTNATTRQVQGDETVEGRLARLSRSDNALNKIAVQNAREQAAASGMIGGSTAAAGAALRASREAMLPIAQQDAQWYGQTARENMDATNRDALSDQEIRSGLLQRDADIRANLYEAASDRTWRSKEANQERVWKSFENNLSYLRSSVDREDQQDFNWATREDDQAWNAWQSGLQRDFDRLMQDDRQDFEGTESERARAQQRTMAYFEMVFGRESMFASVVNGIYSNTNLTPAQQQQAAASARELFTALWQSFNATLGQGIPNIFANPNQPQPTNP